MQLVLYKSSDQRLAGGIAWARLDTLDQRA